LPHGDYPRPASFVLFPPTGAISIVRHLSRNASAIRHILKILVALEILLVIFQSSPAIAATPDADQIRTAAREVTRNLQVQSRLPNDSGVAESPLDRRPINFPFGLRGEGIYLPGGEAIVGLLQWVLIMVLVIGILAVMAILIREPLQSRFQPTLSPPLPLSSDPVPPADPRELLARADRLASEGLFAEAMHCVLLAAMIGLGGPDSRTSWELLRSATLPEPQLVALRGLVVRVERAWFGQQPAGPDDYRQVRGIFDALHSPAAVSA